MCIRYTAVQLSLCFQIFSISRDIVWAHHPFTTRRPQRNIHLRLMATLESCRQVVAWPKQRQGSQAGGNLPNEMYGLTRIRGMSDYVESCSQSGSFRVQDVHVEGKMTLVRWWRRRCPSQAPLIKMSLLMNDSK